MKNNKNIVGFLAMSLCGLLAGFSVSNTDFFIEKANAVEAVVKNNPTIQQPVTSGTINRFSQDFINVSKNVTPAIVTITSTKIVKTNNNLPPEIQNDPYLRRFFGNRGQDMQENKEQGLGSGVIVSSDGTVLTNNHVVSGADTISVTLADKRKYKAKIVGTDPKSDVAVIKILDAQNLPVAKLGDSNNLSVGEWVLAIGNPLGLSSSVTSGIISAKGRGNVGITDFEDFIQTDAAINPGNSGGALVNLKGEVIGINTAIASRTGGYMGIGFAIPSNMANKIMNDLVNKGRVSRGFLGIQIQNIDEKIAKTFNLNNDEGIIIADVSKDSPADVGGLQKYDVVKSVNGVTITDASEFRNKVAANDPGSTINVIVNRNGRDVNLNIKLGEMDNQMASNLQPELEENR